MLSNSSKYALKAVLYLAVNSSVKNKVLAKSLGKSINAPQAYLAKLLQELSKHDIISSLRGPGGGFYLSEGNRTEKLIRIINIIDGENRLTSCMLSLKKCDVNHPCPMHDLVGDTKSNFVKNLEETSVQDLVLDIEEGRSFLPL